MLHKLRWPVFALRRGFVSRRRQSSDDKLESGKTDLSGKNRSHCAAERKRQLNGVR